MTVEDDFASHSKEELLHAIEVEREEHRQADQSVEELRHAIEVEREEHRQADKSVEELRHAIEVEREEHRQADQSVEQLIEAFEIEREQHRIDVETLQAELADAQALLGKHMTEGHADEMNIDGRHDEEDAFDGGNDVELQRLRDEVQQLKEQLQAQQGQAGDESEACAMLQSQLEQQTLRADALEQECELLRQGTKKEGTDQTKQLDDERASLQAKLDESSSRHAAEMQDMQKQAALLQTQLDEAIARAASAKELQQERDNLRMQIEDMSKELERERSSVQARLEEASTRHAAERAELQTKADDAAKVHSSAVDALTKERDSLRETLKSTVEEHSMKVVEFERQRTQLTAQLDEAAKSKTDSTKLDEAEQKNADLQDQPHPTVAQLEAQLRAQASQMEELRRECLQVQAQASNGTGDHSNEVEALKRENASLQLQLDEFSTTLEELEEAATGHLAEMEAKHAAEMEALRGSGEQNILREKQELQRECERLRELLSTADETEAAHVAEIKQLRELNQACALM
eukprot:TRINITY_DN17001_c0_g1_i1.p1 TRINITY_DN17001_c0_g1~~TRINITY_DN17001_c0_g1_i1.p1  ORF type:complete len:522 (+),score=138.22 TRINITY_DN17001_c0_g1_i1:135-1700(+)